MYNNMYREERGGTYALGKMVVVSAVRGHVIMHRRAAGSIVAGIIIRSPTLA
jgi:hypothetical protein